MMIPKPARPDRIHLEGGRSLTVATYPAGALLAINSKKGGQMAMVRLTVAELDELRAVIGADR